MAIRLKQSTTVTIRLGPFLDKADGVTEKTAITPVVEVSKNHGAFAARNSGTSITHDSNGWYAVELNATDTNTLGAMLVKADDAATYLPVWREFEVVPAAVFDSLVGGTDVLPVRDQTMIRQGTAQAGAAGTITLDTGASAIDDFYITGTWCAIVSGTGAEQVRRVNGYVGSTKVLTISPNWKTNPDNTSKFVLLGCDVAAVVQSQGLSSSSLTSTYLTAVENAVLDAARSSHVISGSVGEGVGHASTVEGRITATRAGYLDKLNITGNVAATGEVAAVEADTQDIQSRLPAALVSGRIDASVGSMASNVVTAAAVASDAVTEIQSGLASASELAAVRVDTEDIQSRLPAALVSGHISARLAGVTHTDAVIPTVSTVTDKADYGLSTTALDAIGDEVDAQLDSLVGVVPAAAPPDEPTIREALAIAYASIRNKQTFEKTGDSDGVLVTYAPDGTTELFKSDCSDDGTTFTRGELEEFV